MKKLLIIFFALFVNNVYAQYGEVHIMLDNEPYISHEYCSWISQEHSDLGEFSNYTINCRRAQPRNNINSNHHNTRKSNVIIMNEGVLMFEISCPSDITEYSRSDNYFEMILDCETGTIFSNGFESPD